MIESEPRVHPPPIVYRRTTSEVVFCAQLLVYICATLLCLSIRADAMGKDTRRVSLGFIMLLAKNAAFRPRTQRLRVQQASVCCFSSRKTKTSHCEPQGPPPDPSTFSPSAYEPRPFFRFELIHQSKLSLARVGRIHTPHGVIDTPGYVAVASKCSRLCVPLLYTDLTPLAANGALKGVTFDDADLTGQQLVFANTYHLMLQPGADTVGQAGGLHKYVNRAKDKPFITDSGGFQVSLTVPSTRSSARVVS